MKLALVFSVAAVTVLAQQGPGGMSFIRMSPILNAVDVDQDASLSASEIAGASLQLRKLDRNSDGKLTQEEAGLQLGGGRGEGRGGGRGRGGEGEEPPAAAPTADELTTTLMMFDANKNGKLEKSEVPERMQGMFDRGDTNHDNLLSRDEIAKLAEENRQANQGGPGGRGEGRGGRDGRGPGGPGQFDLAFNALDTDHDNEISPDEITNAAASLKTLDRNGDGQITNDEVTPNFGGRGGFGRGPRGPDGQ